MKKILIAILFFLIFQQIKSQEIIAAQGDSYLNSSGRIDFTIGEPVTETYENDNTVITQGFHQTKLTVTNIKLLTESFDVFVNPNPVSSFLSINIPGFKQDCKVEIYDINSRIVSEQKITCTKSKIDFSSFISGTYILVIKDHKNLAIKIFKIQKTL